MDNARRCVSIIRLLKNSNRTVRYLRPARRRIQRLGTVSNDSGPKYIHKIITVSRKKKNCLFSKKVITGGLRAALGSIRTSVRTYSNAEVVERVFVDVGQLLAQPERVVGHGGDVRVLFAVARVPGQPGRGHVRGAGRLDLLDALEPRFAEQLVEVGYDLVQQPQALHALVVGLQLHVELGKVRYGREYYAHAVALLVVQLLRKGIQCVASKSERTQRPGEGWSRGSRGSRTGTVLHQPLEKLLYSGTTTTRIGASESSLNPGCAEAPTKNNQSQPVRGFAPHVSRRW